MKKILFKPEMIRAILDGKKTQTRRIHKDMRKLRYNVGEVVYVGETYGFIWDTNKAYYAADFATHKPININWKSGKFMPEKYARLFLKITGVKKENLWDISEQSAKAEGFEQTGPLNYPTTAKDNFFMCFFYCDRKMNLDPDYQEVWAYTFEVVKK